jgi:cobalt/nickel transport system permease protein
MSRIEAALANIGSLDALAGQDTSIHRLDPRAKVIVTLFFIVAVVSFDHYAVAPLLPFFVFPVILMATGNIPAHSVLRRLLLASPFVLVVGVFNPLLDREAAAVFGTIEIAGGWISLLSLLLRFTLTVGCGVVLVATTGFTAICMALERLGVPRAFVLQLLFLYRYLFVLAEESVRLVRARGVRSFGNRGTGLRAYSQIIGHLLLRTLDRAQRIHTAMVSRGFTGEIRMSRQSRITGRDVLFMTVWPVVFAGLRFSNLPMELGGLVMEMTP